MTKNRKKKIYFTKYQLLQIWESREDKNKLRLLVKTLAVNPVSAGNAIGYLKSFISGERLIGLGTPRAYRDALAMISSTSGKQSEGNARTPMDLQYLEQSFKQLQEVVATVVANEVDARSREILRVKNEEITELKRLLKKQADEGIAGMVEHKIGQSPIPFASR